MHQAKERAADYPRPPALVADPRRVRIEFAGQAIFDGGGAFRVLETFHPPSWYLPPGGFAQGVLRPVPGGSVCEWKGRARYFDIVVGDRRAGRAAWSYPDPTPAFAAIAAYVAVYAGRMDGCLVDGVAVAPQPGGFYGGWITDDVEGPFKGGPGTLHW